MRPPDLFVWCFYAIMITGIYDEADLASEIHIYHISKAIYA